MLDPTWVQAWLHGCIKPITGHRSSTLIDPLLTTPAPSPDRRYIDVNIIYYVNMVFILPIGVLNPTSVCTYLNYFMIWHCKNGVFRLRKLAVMLYAEGKFFSR
jgi:hypothetical protein